MTILVLGILAPALVGKPVFKETFEIVDESNQALVAIGKFNIAGCKGKRLRGIETIAVLLTASSSHSLVLPNIRDA